jgi:hypothetical protein
MIDLIKLGWIKREFTSPYRFRFQRISILMRAYKSKEIENFEYVLIDKYFIDSNNNLYFIGNNEVYSIDLNDDFYIDIYKDPEGDYRKIKYVCSYNYDNIIKYELASNKYLREKRIDNLLNSKID